VIASIGTHGLVFEGPGRPLEVAELLLDPPGEGEVLVRMVASGVCHSDLHVVDGDWSRPTGVVLGHEGAAVVEKLGPGVSERPASTPAGAAGLRPGDLVVLSWTAPCDRCASCLRVEPWLCADPRGSGHRLSPDLVRLHRGDGTPVGVYSGIGTFGERQVVAAEAAIPVDGRTPPQVAALIGCAVTTGVGAVLETARVRTGDSVAVVGLGGVGLSAIMGAALAGADPIVAVDIVLAKHELALSSGATHAASPDDARSVIRALTGTGADHVLEAVGSAATVHLAIDLTRPGGTTTLVGMPPQHERVPVDVYRFVEEGRRLLGSNYGSAVPARAFPLIASRYLAGDLPLDLLVTETIGLGDVGAALDAMRHGAGARRVVVYETDPALAIGHSS
jgi:S-(hydroxymethyl)glutathione dehydrogenase/alcohol dehydrogenase